LEAPMVKALESPHFLKNSRMKMRGIGLRTYIVGFLRHANSNGMWVVIRGLTIGEICLVKTPRPLMLEKTPKGNEVV